MGVSAVGTVSASARTTGFQKGAKVRVYYMSKGDTLYSIAKKYNISVEQLCIRNGIKLTGAPKLKEGRRLIIPMPAVQSTQPSKKAVKPASKAVAKSGAKAQTNSGVKTAAKPNSEAKKPEHAQAAGTKAPAASKAAEQKIKQSNPFSGSYDDFKSELAARESTSRTNVMNNAGYAGKYQIGKAGMEEAGVYKRAKDEKQNKNYTGTFTGEFGVTNITSFLSSPIAQEKTMDALQRAQWKQIQRRNLEKYSGTNISYVVGNSTNSVLVTDSGMLAGAHLVGSENLAKFLRSNGKTIPKDGNGTPITEYMKNFGNYDITTVKAIN